MPELFIKTRNTARKIWSGLGLALALSLLSAGCAKIDELNAHNPPHFCTELPRPGWAAYTKHPASGPWFEVYELGTDLYAIAEPYQWQEVINYLIIGDERALLFDSGNGMGNIKAVTDQLTSLPVTVLASHSHIDHVGGHWQFENVLAPDTEFTRTREQGMDNASVSEEASPAALCTDLPKGVSQAIHHIKPFTPTGRVKDGTQIALGGVTLEVLEIAGHTPDSLALLDRANGRLFTGDSYYKGPIWLFAPETDLLAYQKTLERLTMLVPELKALHGAHNEPFSQPEELIKLRNAFKSVISGQAVPQEVNAAQARYEFETFELLLQAGHEVWP